MSLRILAAIALLSPLVTPARADDAPATNRGPEAAAPGSPPEAPGPDPIAAWDEQRPPPGTPEEVALWRAGVEVSRAVTLARLEANKMQWEHRQRKYDERLASLAREEGKPEAKRAAELLDRYNRALAHNYATMTRQWPVDPTRVCLYPTMHFESALYSPEHRKKATQVLVTREDLQECLDKARPALKVMADSNRELAGIFGEAGALLPPLAAGGPRAAAGAQPAAPAPDAPAAGR